MTDVAPGSSLAREAGSLPFPDKPVGTVNDEMPFDHLIVVMMENHSFDNLLGGAVADARGRRRADVRRRRRARPTPTRAPPVPPAAGHRVPVAEHRSGVARDAELEGDARADQRRRDGRIRSARRARASRWATTRPEVLPFAYSLASTFTLANRWFCSVPGPTYPNRRFLLAGTAYGGTTNGSTRCSISAARTARSSTASPTSGISWCDYFTDVPMTLVIPTIILKHLDHHHRLEQVLPRLPGRDAPGGQLRRPGRRACFARSPPPRLAADGPQGRSEAARRQLRGRATGRDRGRPAGHVLRGGLGAQGRRGGAPVPAWDRTLLIYTYDEHGGYYDHVPPPRGDPARRHPAAAVARRPAGRL